MNANNRASIIRTIDLSVMQHYTQKRIHHEAVIMKRNRNFRELMMMLLVILLLITLAATGYRMWRWSVEEPLIKMVEKEVIIEKEIIEEVIREVEREVIPPECTQIRRNGKVYVSCDGVTIDGVPTISESNVEVPELLGDQNQNQD